MISKFLKSLILSITLAFGICLQANAQNTLGSSPVDGVSGAQLEQVAKVFFDFAQLTADGEGDPLILVQHRGLKMGLATFDCTETGAAAERTCQTVMILVIFEGPYGVEALAYSNVFNKQVIFGTGVLDQDFDLALEMAFRVRGVTAQYMTDNFTVFRDAILPVFLKAVVGRSPKQKSGQTASTNDIGPKGIHRASLEARRQIQPERTRKMKDLKARLLAK